VSGISLLNRINGKGADGIDAELIDLTLSDWFGYVRDAHV
jgi:hypothetical protein